MAYNKKQDIFDLFLKEILPYTMDKYVDNKFFPVIIGGVDLSRCTNNYLKSEINDIDVKFICKSDSDDVIYKAHTYRMDMLNEILSKYNAFKADDMPEMFISEMMIQFNRRVELYYTNGNKKVTIIDTGIIVVNKAVDNEFILNFMSFSYFPSKEIKGIDASMKVEYYNNTPYISCDWLYLDTIRMCLYWIYKFSEKNITTEQKRFMKKKLMKYIVKLSAMNIAYIKNKEYKDQFKSLMKKINSSEITGINVSMMIKEIKTYDKNIMKFDKLIKKCENVLNYLLQFNEINEKLFNILPNQMKSAKNNTIYLNKDVDKKKVLDTFISHYERVSFKYDKLSINYPEEPFKILKNSIIFDNKYTLLSVK